jgi:hypothetical protein
MLEPPAQGIESRLVTGTMGTILENLVASLVRQPYRASQNAEYSSVKAPWTYFFSPAGPDHSVVSSNPSRERPRYVVEIVDALPARDSACCLLAQSLNYAP